MRELLLKSEETYRLTNHTRYKFKFYICRRGKLEDIQLIRRVILETYCEINKCSLRKNATDFGVDDHLQTINLICSRQNEYDNLQNIHSTITKILRDCYQISYGLNVVQKNQNNEYFTSGCILTDINYSSKKFQKQSKPKKTNYQESKMNNIS